MVESSKVQELNFTDLDFNIGNAQISVIMQPGFFYIQNPWFSKLHCHSCYEIHYIEQGEAKLNFSGCTEKLAENSVTIISPFVYHYTENSNAPIKKTSFMFYLKKSKTEDQSFDFYQQYHDIFEKIDTFLSVDCNHVYFKEMINTIKQFENGNASASFKFKNLFSLAFMETIDCLRELFQMNYKETDHRSQIVKEEENIRRIQIESFLDTHFDKNCTLLEMANHLYLSPRQTDRIFEQFFGLSFHQAVLMYRMERAKRMIVERVSSNQEIAFQLGYSSYNGFYKAFVHYTGMTPQKYSHI